MTVYMNDGLRERLTALVTQKTAEELGLSDASVADASKEEVVGLVIQRHCEPIDQEAWYIDPVAFKKRKLFELWRALYGDEQFVNVAGQYYFVKDVKAMLDRLA